jgi:hypothetical protein
MRGSFIPLVIPAKAGTQSKQIASLRGFIFPCWAPAFAGVTAGATEITNV